MIPLLALLLNLFLLTNRSLSEESFPTCGDCWCVPGNNGADPCPYSEKPPTEFSTETVQAFLGQTALNPYGLYCNPYKESTCQTSPPQLYMDTDSAVCAFVYPQNPDGSTSCSSYYLQTYRSRDDAYAAGAFITHEGSCGLCSTSIDLAIYLTQDFTSAGKKCATKGLFNETEGFLCYQSLGLTPECAKIWNYDGIYDGKACAVDCMGSVTAPNNGPAPACELNECLQCDEEKAGPIFSAYGGRTRRRSGLLSEIIRSCDSIARNISHVPCSAMNSFHTKV